MTYAQQSRDEKSKRTPKQIAWHERAQRLGLHVATCWTVEQAVDAVIAVKAKVRAAMRKGAA